MDASPIIRANNNEIDVINDNNKKGIQSITTIPANNNHDPLILSNTSDSDTLDNKDQNKNTKNDEDNLSNNDSL